MRMKENITMSNRALLDKFANFESKERLFFVFFDFGICDVLFVFYIFCEKA